MNSTKFQIMHNHAGIALMVSGERDEDETTITRVTVADSQIDLFDLFQPSELARMADKIDAQLDREMRAHNAEARAERHQWHKEFAIAA